MKWLRWFGVLVILISVLELSGLNLFIKLQQLFSRNDSHWNWCPDSVVQVKDMVQDKLITNPQALAKFCLIPQRQNRNSPTPATNFFLLYVASSANGDKTYLEMDESKNFLRANNKVFPALYFRLQTLNE